MQQHPCQQRLPWYTETQLDTQNIQDIQISTGSADVTVATTEEVTKATGGESDNREPGTGPLEQVIPRKGKKESGQIVLS